MLTIYISVLVTSSDESSDDDHPAHNSEDSVKIVEDNKSVTSLVSLCTCAKNLL